MYGITEDTKETVGVQPIPAGINENIKVLVPTFEPLKEGNAPMLAYHFRDESGRELKKIVWPVDPDRTRRMAEDYPKEHKRDDKVRGFVKGKTISPEEAVIIAGERFNTFNKHILNRFVDEKTIVDAMKEVNSYDTFAKTVVALMEKANLDPLMRLKVRYDNKGYLEIPDFPPFIEDMSVPKAESKLVITQWDRMTPPNANPVETPEDVDTSEGFDDIDDDAAF